MGHFGSPCLRIYTLEKVRCSQHRFNIANAMLIDELCTEDAWDSWGPQQDLSTAKIMGDILDAESQELVVLNGK